MRDGRLPRVLFIFLVTLSVGAVLLTFGAKVGTIWFGEYVSLYGELTFDSLSKDTIAGIFDKGYGSYVIVSLGFWLLGVFMMLWSLIAFAHRFSCLAFRECYKCDKYLICHSPAHQVKEF